MWFTNRYTDFTFWTVCFRLSVVNAKCFHVSVWFRFDFLVSAYKQRLRRIRKWTYNLISMTSKIKAITYIEFRLIQFSSTANLTMRYCVNVYVCVRVRVRGVGMGAEKPVPIITLIDTDTHFLLQILFHAVFFSILSKCLLIESIISHTNFLLRKSISCLNSYSMTTRWSRSRFILFHIMSVDYTSTKYIPKKYCPVCFSVVKRCAFSAHD